MCIPTEHAWLHCPLSHTHLSGESHSHSWNNHHWHNYEQYSVATLAHAVLHGSYKPRHGVATPADSEEWAHCCGTCTPTPHKLCSRTLAVMVNKPWQRIAAEAMPHDNCCNFSLNSFACYQKDKCIPTALFPVALLIHTQLPIIVNYIGLTPESY